MKKPALRFFCFGNLELWYGDTTLALPPTHKSQSLLAYLVLHRQRPLPREQLMTLFWGERPTQRARRSLSTALWHIRRCQPEGDLLQADNRTVQFSAEAWLDIEAFRELATSRAVADLEAAAALFRGPFLDGFYDEWAVEQRYQLQNDHSTVLLRLMERYETSRQHRQTLTTALKLLGEDPLQEAAHRAAMRAYAWLGQRNAALAQYDRCRERVAEELGLDPMPETTDLAEQIQDGRFPPEPVRRQPAAISPVGPEPSPGAGPPAIRPAIAWPFVGRVAEMNTLQGWWRGGQERLLLIGGEAGVGKTRLAQEFGRELSGSFVLQGRCYEFERMLPYQPFAEALRPLALALPAADWQQMPAWTVTEIGRLIPELGERLPGQLGAELGPDRPRLFRAIGRLLGALAAQRPLLLVLDDLHWATESTLELLHYLTRQLAEQPVRILGTFRQEQIGPEHPLARMARQLSREKLAQTLTLSRLPAPAVKALLAQIVGAGEGITPLAERLHQETDGNAFFLTETIQALWETGEETGSGAWWPGAAQGRPLKPPAVFPLPATVKAAILGRVGRLADAAQEAIRLAAVLGREFDFDLLQVVWGRDEEQVLEVLELWLRARLVAEGTGAQGRDYEFTHHKIQEVLYAAEPRRRRQHFHGRVAQAMERLYEPAEAAGELAYHYLQARQADESLTVKAIHYLRLAGERAMAQYAHEEASAFFGQALSLAPESDLDVYAFLLAREQALDYLGSREAQAEDLVALEKLAQAASGESGLTAEHKTVIALRRTNYGIVTGDYPAAVAAARRAAVSAPAGELLAEARAQWGLALFHQGDYESAAAQLQQALPLARSAALPRTEAKILTVMGLVYWQQSRYQQAKACFSEALEICRRPHINHPAGEANALGNLGIIHRYQGDYLQAKTYFEQTLAIWQAIGHRRGEGLYLMNLGVVAMDMGDVSGARTHCEQALAIAREIGDRHIEQTALNNLSAIYHLQGSFGEALAAALQALEICQAIGDQQGMGISNMNLGEASNGLGELGKARAYYQQALVNRRERGDRRGEALALIGLGEVSRQEGDLATASAHLEQARAICQEIGSAAEEGRALHGLAQLALDRGDGAAAAGYLQEGELVSRDVADPLLAGKLMVARARLAGQKGETDLAYKYGRQALDIAQRTGARPQMGDAWFACGRALEELDRPAEAAAAYRLALEVRRAISQKHRLAEVLDGLARVSGATI